MGCIRTRKTKDAFIMEEEIKKKPTNDELASLCEKTAYDRKGEDIIRIDMTGIDGAQSDNYIICSCLSAPHVGAIAERIKREVRETFGIRPIAVDGTPESQWMIVDYGGVMIHVMTVEARKKYMIEDIWSDAPREDIAAKLDAEYARRKKSSSEQA